MRSIRFDGGRTGVVVGDRVLDAAEALPELGPGADWADLIARWGEHRGALEALEGEDSGGMQLSEVLLEPPLPSPGSRIFAMGGNFPMHTAQTAEKLEIELSDEVKSEEKEAPPWGFYVIPGTTVGPEADVSPPPGTQRFDYEAEVAVVLTGDPVEGGMVGIWGYTAWNDFSIRDAAFGLSKVDHGPLTWSLQKNFTPRTPRARGWWSTTRPTTADADRLPSERRARQDGNTREMKYSYGEIAAHISEYLPLRPAT